MKRLTIVVVLMALTAAACGDSADAPSDESPVTTAPAQTSTTTTPPDDDPDLEPAPVDDKPPTLERDPDELLPGVPSAVAATALADRLGVAVSDRSRTS